MSDLKHVFGFGFLGVTGLFFLGVFFGAYFTVGQNQMAVVTRFGQLSYVAGPGFHLKMPYVGSVENYRTDIQDLYPTADGKRIRVNTYTIDNQEVDVDFTVFYRIPADKIGFVFTNNRDYAQRLYSMTVDRLKVAMGMVNVQSVAEKRGELRDAIKKTLAHDAASLGLDVTDVQLTDLQYTESFRGAVNEAAVAKAVIERIEYERQQSMKAAEIAKIRAEGEANAIREKARGDADARVLQATAEAKATELNGFAKAEAIKSQGAALRDNPSLIELRKAEGWNGALPVNVYGSAPIPFLSLSDKH